MVATISLYMDIAAKKEAQRMDMIHRTKTLTHQIIKETRKFSKALVGPALTRFLSRSLSEKWWPASR